MSASDTIRSVMTIRSSTVAILGEGHVSILEVFAVSVARSPMQFVGLVFFVHLVAGAVLKEHIDINQIVSIDNVNVFGGDSDGVQDVCQHFASNSGRVVKVQGTGIKVSVFLRNVCEEEHAEEHTQVVGSCDTQEASNTVQELSPATLEKLAHYQSYKIEKC